jgi:hypothetical protein
LPRKRADTCEVKRKVGGRIEEVIGRRLSTRVSPVEQLQQLRGEPSHPPRPGFRECVYGCPCQLSSASGCGSHRVATHTCATCARNVPETRIWGVYRAIPFFNFKKKIYEQNMASTAPVLALPRYHFGCHFSAQRFSSTANVSTAPNTAVYGMEL